MIAKWYQKACSPPPKAAEKTCDMPTASVGAPPVRETRVCSSTDAAADASWSGVMVNPRLATASEADCSVGPIRPAGEFIA